VAPLLCDLGQLANPLSTPEAPSIPYLFSSELLSPEALG
jgi:hypothetical protein